MTLNWLQKNVNFDWNWVSMPAPRGYSPDLMKPPRDLHFSSVPFEKPYLVQRKGQKRTWNQCKHSAAWLPSTNFPREGSEMFTISFPASLIDSRRFMMKLFHLLSLFSSDDWQTGDIDVSWGVKPLLSIPSRQAKGFERVCFLCT